MPKASPLPRKFMSQLEDAQGDLRRIASQSRNLVEDIETSKTSVVIAKSVLREIEATAYRIALDLSQVEVATSCDACPAAPAKTKYQAHLFALATTLQQQANLARRCAEESEVFDDLNAPNTYQ